MELLMCVTTIFFLPEAINAAANALSACWYAMCASASIRWHVSVSFEYKTGGAGRNLRGIE